MEENKNTTMGALGFSFGILIVYAAIVFLVLLIFFKI
jgi:hypothetical protein